MPLKREQRVDRCQAIRHNRRRYACLANFPSLQRYTSYSFLGAGAFGPRHAAVHAEIGPHRSGKADRNPRSAAAANGAGRSSDLAQFPPASQPSLRSITPSATIAPCISSWYARRVPADALRCPIGQALSLVRDTAQGTVADPRAQHRAPGHQAGKPVLHPHRHRRGRRLRGGAAQQHHRDGGDCRLAGLHGAEAFRQQRQGRPRIL